MSAATCCEPATHANLVPRGRYALDDTLSSGQVFRWTKHKDTWCGVVEGKWVALTSTPQGIRVQTTEAVNNWAWLAHFLQTEFDVATIHAALGDDPWLLQAMDAMPGLRILQQDPWECLASFIVSSTKQVVQIQQILDLLCRTHGKPVKTLPGYPPAWTFPSIKVIAGLNESDLRACKMGFRAPYLLKTARMLLDPDWNLDKLKRLPLSEARHRLTALPGVGDKIAHCVLLFSLGFYESFPIDVWIARALCHCYFPRRRAPSMKRLQAFAEDRFGIHAGYAQQYLYHYFRVKNRAALGSPAVRAQTR